MEVILKEDVRNLGFANDLVRVKNGYGMNYLIPRGLAVLANEGMKKMHAENLKQRAHKMKKQKEEAAQIGTTIEAVTLTISMKAAEGGTLFGSVTTQHIADALKKVGHVIDKKQISLKDPHIKKAGSYEAEITLHREVKVSVPFEVTVADS